MRVTTVLKATFDGDQTQFKLIIDSVEREQFRRLSSHLGIMDTSKPLAINGVITMHPECISMVNNFLDNYRLDGKDVELVPTSI